jgi:glc operon protein GlcG
MLRPFWIAKFGNLGTPFFRMASEWRNSTRQSGDWRSRGGNSAKSLGGTDENHVRRILSFLLAVALMTGSSFAQLADKKTLTLTIAKQIAAAAEAEAIKNKFTMVIAVLDDGGNLIYLERMDETQLASIQIAQGKAHTALAFKRPTKALEDAVAGGRNAILSMPGAVMVEGGLPLATPDGKIIGSIGVSGGTSPQDGIVAKAGVDAFAKMLGQ